MKKKLKIFIPIGILVLIIGAGVAYMVNSNASPKEDASTATFEFSATEAPGWFASANIYPDAAIKTPQATVSRIVAQGTAEKPEGNCFVQYSYWANSSKDVNQALKASEDSGNKNLTLIPAGVVQSSMKVSSKDVKYQLHQYDLVGMPGEQMSRGQQLAYFKAGTGYVEIRGYCLTVEELSITAPVFSAVSLKE